MPPAITVCVPFYTGHEYLKLAIASVLNQSRDDWALVVSDDGPDAATEAVVAEFKDARIHYRRNEANLGMVGNWNRCLDYAETDLVTLLHADDELLPSYCELMTGSAPLHPTAAAMFCQAWVIDAAGRRCFSVPEFVKGFLQPGGRGPVVLEGEGGLRSLLRGNYIMCPTLCYRRSVLAGRRFAAGWKFAQDMEFTSRLLLEGGRLVGLREEAYAYRRHPANATSQYTESLLRFEEEVRLYRELAAKAAAAGWRRARAEAAWMGIIKLHLGYGTLRDLLRGRLTQARREAAFLWQLFR